MRDILRRDAVAEAGLLVEADNRQPDMPPLRGERICSVPFRLPFVRWGGQDTVTRKAGEINMWTFKRKAKAPDGESGFDFNISQVKGAKTNRCPVCGGTKVNPGPFTNVTCCGCGSLLNLTPFGTDLIRKS